MKLPRWVVRLCQWADALCTYLGTTRSRREMIERLEWLVQQNRTVCPAPVFKAEYPTEAVNIADGRMIVRWINKPKFPYFVIEEGALTERFNGPSKLYDRVKAAYEKLPKPQ
jgi:hypothetical protein